MKCVLGYTYWIVTMYRYGDHEKHSYVLGVFSSFEQALKAGNAEQAYRADKYIWETIAFELDRPGVSQAAQDEM